ncbi:MAG: hypothetical protein ACN6OJ_18650 [Chryseobacterium sp.]|uniref:hypothetical protein n=1 Tax=Chryseobacterium sp. TaxID=1871047 RepID=UPI003D11FAC7
MKNNKLVFIIFLILIFHAIVSITNNIYSLSYFKDIKNIALNPVGKIYAQIVPTDTSYYPDMIMYYSNYTGIDRGYAFYSPNLNRNKIEYSFSTNNNTTPIPISFNTKESNVKYMSMSINLTNMFDNRKKRNKLVKDISIFMLNQNKEIKDMNFIVSVRRIRLLNEKTLEDRKNINAYNIKKLSAHE